MSFNFKNPSKLFAWLYSLACPFYARKVYRKLLESLQFKTAENILDFGSGAGILAKKILKRMTPFSHLTCLDSSKAFINKAKKNLRKFENVDFIIGDIRDEQIPKNTFNKIFITWVIHHLPNSERDEIIAKIVESLNKNGDIYVIEYVSLPHGIEKNDLNALFKKLEFFPHELYHRKHTVLIKYSLID
jgi:demethylmenaquinone methyltransferase/2-methoxy-6-polyprenyl-1,4-benzoquinol methylase